MTIKFGWRVPAFPVDGSQGQDFSGQIINTLNEIHHLYDSAWVADHVIPWATFVDKDVDTLECFATMSYLAGAFPKLDFGSIVLCQSYRNPALLAKMAATLQLLSGGRFIMGIGAGWKEDEYMAYNYPFPKASVRIAQMSETVQIMKAMWTNSPATFEGKHYQIHEAHCSPMPSPTPPIMIGGGGEKLTLRVVAKYADWWDMPGPDVETYTHKLNVLRQHCAEVGRDADEIVQSWGATVSIAETESEAKRIAEGTPFGNNAIVGTPEQIIEKLRAYTDLGVENLIMRFADFPKTDGVKLFGETVIPALR